MDPIIWPDIAVKGFVATAHKLRSIVDIVSVHIHPTPPTVLQFIILGPVVCYGSEICTKLLPMGPMLCWFWIQSFPVFFFIKIHRNATARPPTPQLLDIDLPIQTISQKVQLKMHLDGINSCNKRLFSHFKSWALDTSISSATLQHHRCYQQ